MKTLVVYDNKGQLVFTQTNATDSYDLIVEDVADNKEVIGVDMSTGKCILADRQATTEEKEQLKLQLESKNIELEKTKQELLDTQATIVDMTENNLLKWRG